MGSGGYVICEYDSVKKNFPEFKRVMDSLEAQAISEASARWAPLTYGGFTPSAGQFGRTTVLPPLFSDQTVTQMVTWKQNLAAALVGTAPVILNGSAAANTIPEDYMVAVAGFAFLDKSIRITEIKFQIGDRKYPRINIEEAMSYNKPAIVFEEGFILNEEEGFELWGYIECSGPLRMVPLGFQLNRVPNKVQVTNTGAAL